MHTSTYQKHSSVNVFQLPHSMTAVDLTHMIILKFWQDELWWWWVASVDIRIFHFATGDEKSGRPQKTQQSGHYISRSRFKRSIIIGILSGNRISISQWSRRYGKYLYALPGFFVRPSSHRAPRMWVHRCKIERRGSPNLWGAQYVASIEI